MTSSPVAKIFLNVISECKASLSSKQERRLKDVLAQNAKALSPIPGPAKNFEYHINLKDKEPIRRPPYYLPKDKTALISLFRFNRHMLRGFPFGG